ncbi:MAG TPA: sugar ABC transporter permease [Anaerolineales bacterium]|nr:sugar ABC transporter permease [Anaerolineales bacterium]
MIKQIRKSLVWYLFIAPTFILFGLFTVYPTLETFRLSFFREVATQQELVGFAHYVRLLTNQVFINALLNTVLLGILFLILVFPLSLILASFLNNVRVAPNVFKMIYFLPQVTSTVAVALIFSYVFQPNWGLINGTLRSLGVENLPLWLADPRYVVTGSRSAVTLLAVWVALGYYMLIFLAGLQAIPTDFYDAAVVDGANPLQVWWYITLPSLRPSFIFLFITGTIDAMSRFSDLWMLGGPGGTPARSLQSIVMFIYQTAFEGNDFNLASAASVILFLIVLGITIFNFRTTLQSEFSSRSG